PASRGPRRSSCRSPTAMQAMLVEEKPAVVSFHFGLPSADVIAALKRAGITLFATATNLDEARQVAAAG
ncbi:nitronate monooxygenase, partial [Burkholderia cenocepacia]|uniref:nitronate monooxygenase n=1 Tax=Burkholderia cenocepacia TaxID=95486 RepID=UPI0024B71021